MTDAELVRGIATGSADALQVLVERFHGPLLRYLWQACGSREDAEDLATQALLQIRADAHNYRGAGSLKAWIFRVAYRELLQFRRRQALIRLLPLAKSQDVPSSKPEDAVVLVEALGRIPSTQRSAFLLTEVEGLTVDEAAQALGVPAGTVKSRCHHARLKLRSLLAGAYGESHAEPAID